MSDLANKLRPSVAALKEAAAKGDKRAQRVISLYQMHVACPADPGAPALCEAAFDEWQQARRTSGCLG